MKMEVSGLLCNSFLCRLCGAENKKGTSLFPNEETEQDLSELVNKYLPLKVENDNKYPTRICPGCYIQLEAMKYFLDLIIEGQAKLRELYRLQMETLKRQEKQKQQLEKALKTVNPTSSVETYTIHSDETGEKFLIQIFSEGPLFPPDHELTLRTEGLTKPRRKRGRPPKAQQMQNEQDTSKEIIQQEQEICKEGSQDEEIDQDTDGRRRRRIKVPSRFNEAVQGKELEKILKEEGVDDESGSDSEAGSKWYGSGKEDEVIGHLQSKEGENLGELVVINKGTGRTKVKGKPNGMVKKRKKYDCNLCGKEFLHFGRYEFHKNFHKNIKYQCSQEGCQISSDSKEDIKIHQTETGHEGITAIENFDSYGHLQKEEPPETTQIEPETDVDEKSEIMKVEDKNPTSITCEICGKTFARKQNYEIHFRAVHEQSKPYKCDQCDKSFPYLNTYRLHMVQHKERADKTYPCDVCEKVFHHPSSLVYHREAEHNNGRRFVCNKCGKFFKHKQLLQRHQLVHSEERPHACKMCGSCFKTRANLLNHMSIHTGEKKYYCTLCPQSFAHKTSLTLHTRWHNGQKPYQCDACSKRFSQKGNLAEHKRIHTGEKPYCCDHCGRKFTTSSQFKLHVKRHTGERPWKCEYCAKTFLHKDTWKCHTRRHRNERPYQCSRCFRGFTEQWAMKKHERMHTGERPYVCDICEKSFADCSNLTKHKKIHNYTKLRPEINIVPHNADTNSTDFKVLTEDEGDNRIVYVTCQTVDSTENSEETFVQIMDDLDRPNEPHELKEVLLTDGFKDESMQSVSDIRYQQILDQDGNGISLAMQDGQEMKVVTTITDGQQNIQGLMPNGSLVPMNLTMQDGKAVVEILGPAIDLKPQSEENIEDSLGDTIISSPNAEALDSNIQFLTKLDNNIQFLTEDGENVCLVTAINVDDQINQQYLTMA